MYSPLELHQLANEAYNDALRQATQRRLVTLVTRRENNLLSLDAILKRFRLVGQRSLGMQTIDINDIVGTAGRVDGFDRQFHPRQTTTQSRWMDVVKAWYQGVGLPPVELRKAGGVYFVIDGHHRISVARQQGQEFIDAYVTEMDLVGDDQQELCLAE